MGVIEFHFHEPDVEFSPSMTTGGREKTDDKDTVSVDDNNQESDTDRQHGTTGDGKGMRRAVVLGALIGLGILLAWKRRGNGDTDPADGLDAEDEIEVYN